MKIEIGVEFDTLMRDKITGFEGIVTGIAAYHNGCNKVHLEPVKLGTDGKIIDGVWLDEQRVAPIPKATSGGPMSLCPKP